jgi:plasmid stabilization system protein ParE
MLVRQPQIGEAFESAQAGMRFVIVGNYVIYYVIQSGRVRIVRVLHGARDVHPGLFDDETVGGN